MDADTVVFLGCGFSAVGLLVVTAFLSTERKIMGVNEALLLIKSNLTEATAELVEKIADLKGQLASGDPVDPALLAEVEGLAQGLADIVENQPVEVVGATTEPVTEEAATEAVAEEAVAEEAVAEEAVVEAVEQA